MINETQSCAEISSDTPGTQNDDIQPVSGNTPKFDTWCWVKTWRLTDTKTEKDDNIMLLAIKKTINDKPSNGWR